MRAILAVAAIAAACSSNSSTTTGAQGCPATVPPDGAPCAFTKGGGHCEYGGNAHGVCVTSADCSTDFGARAPTWHVYPAALDCGTNGPKCAATYGIAEGTRCDGDLGVTCDYDQGRCGCVRCASDGGAGAQWHCRRWNDVASGCPSPRPLEGTACTSEGLLCDYAQCCSGPSLGLPLRCSEGAWKVYVDGGCLCGLSACP